MFDAFDNEGTFLTTLTTEVNPGWVSDSNQYVFNFPVDIGVNTTFIKLPSRELIIFIDIPQKKTFFGKINLSEIKTTELGIGLTWKNRDVKLYINGQLSCSFTIEEEDFVRAEFTLDTLIHPVSLSKFIFIINEMNRLFSSAESIINLPDKESIILGSSSGFGRDLVELESLSTGSFKGVIKVPKKIFNFVSGNFVALLATAHGYSQRIAESYVSKKEAEAVQALQLANQAKIETLKSAYELNKIMIEDLERLRPDLDEKLRAQLLEQGIKQPLNNISNILIENGLIFSIEEKNEDE